jgi:hypothetical protein
MRRWELKQGLSNGALKGVDDELNLDPKLIDSILKHTDSVMDVIHHSNTTAVEAAMHSNAKTVFGGVLADAARAKMADASIATSTGDASMREALTENPVDVAMTNARRAALAAVEQCEFDAISELGSHVYTEGERLVKDAPGVLAGAAFPSMIWDATSGQPGALSSIEMLQECLESISQTCVSHVRASQESESPVQPEIEVLISSVRELASHCLKAQSQIRIQRQAQVRLVLSLTMSALN